MEKRELYRVISDFFAVPGLFCLFLGTLWWLAGQGAFRGLSYVWGNALRLLTFQQAKPYKPKENKGRVTRPLLIAGAVCVVIAGLFAWLYHS